jgi:hypothetical protein
LLYKWWQSPGKCKKTEDQETQGLLPGGWALGLCHEKKRLKKPRKKKENEEEKNKNERDRP